MWAQRKNFFFKPVDGYGGKAVYRGAKLTKRVGANIEAGLFGDAGADRDHAAPSCTAGQAIE